MNLLHRLCLLAIFFLIFSALPARADILKNHFASITVNGKKVGHVHYTARHDDDGILQELKRGPPYPFWE
jgi:hypothetical protein